MRGEVLWTPADDAVATTRMGAFLRAVEAGTGIRLDGYHDLWRWSVDDLDGFWRTVADQLGVRWHDRPARFLADPSMPGARWCPGGTLNWAEHCLGPEPSDPSAPALLSRSQTRADTDLTMVELRDLVARCRAGLTRLGVVRGDRVAAYLPNIAEAAVTLLAAASLGAVFTSCAPEFGTRAVIDRLAQVGPTVLVTVDGYRYGARVVDKVADVAAIRAALPTLRATVLVAYLDPAAARDRVPGAVAWDELLIEAGPLTFDAVPFDHPLYILYSSGTTGLPKAIVHGHGGITLEHLKVLALHHDLGPDDRFFWFTTTGWMMWNYLVSGLATGSAVVCFDGDPGWPDLGALWRLVATTGTTVFGAGAAYLQACRAAGLRPHDEVGTSSLRALGSTGGPLSADGFRWAQAAVGPDVQVQSMSGGTDVCTAFVGMAPLLPVRAGEISARCLGAAIEAYDPAGRPVVDQQGELVITAPLPSMPVGFWDDEGGRRYRAAYFETYPGVWHHGDWVTFSTDGACVISGRSDATLNRGGVRLGTADFYAAVDTFDEVLDSLVVHLDPPADDLGGEGELLLFVVLVAGCPLDDDLRRRIGARLRAELSPRHVPDRIVAVAAVPRTLSGKLLEVPVKRILSGIPAEVAASRDSLADPSALDPFIALAAVRPPSS
ncbi:MAG: acetoacetate--CoA ligase [Acidimicrobiales bacterium]